MICCLFPKGKNEIIPNPTRMTSETIEYLMLHQGIAFVYRIANISNIERTLQFLQTKGPQTLKNKINKLWKDKRRNRERAGILASMCFPWI